MTDAPEKIWAYAGSFKMWRDHKTDMGQRQTEYTRTDVTEARIAELERALQRIKGWAVGASGQTTAETYMRAIACETLKGED
jgi:hypothetical protein